MRRALLVIAATGTLTSSASAHTRGAPPDDAAPPSAGRDAAIDAALGLPPGGPGEDFGGPPQGTVDPGYTDTQTKRAADKTYGSTAKTFAPDGAEQQGLVITDYGGLQGPDEEPPEFHVVQQGDTMWDISGQYYGDPYQWPKVWSYNEHVTNPHWIFPGDRLRLTDPSDPRARGGDGPALGFSKTRVPDGARGRGRGRGADGTYTLTQQAFVDAKQFETAMTVIGGAEAAVMLATLDTAYMSYDAAHPPVRGERLVIYAPQEPVYDIKNKEILGYIVLLMSDVEIESIAREAAEGTIYNAVNPVERGYKVGPLRRRFQKVEEEEADKCKRAVIVATLNDTGPIVVGEPWSLKRQEKRERKRQRQEKRARKRKTHVLVGEEQFVVVDVGKSDNLRVGNVLEVVRKGDEYTEKRVFHIPYEDGWPRRVIGTLLVLEVQADTALAVTTWSARELERGDHVELHGREMGDKECEDDQRARDKTRANASADATTESANGKAKAKGRVQLGK